MRHFNPSLRVDQLAEYRTSGHGKALARATRRVATCVSCHGAHGILPVKDARSPVYPTRIAETCNGCHGDAGLMAAHKLPSDVYAKYRRSVHFEALTKKGDLSAPTCNSCHGNHGAAPPQVASVANVCGTCHAIFAEQFKASPHWEAFAEMGLPGLRHLPREPRHRAPDRRVPRRRARKASAPSCHEAGTEGARAAAAMYEDLVSAAKGDRRREGSAAARGRGRNGSLAGPVRPLPGRRGAHEGPHRRPLLPALCGPEDRGRRPHGDAHRPG